MNENVREAIQIIKSMFTDDEYRSLSQHQKNQIHIEVLDIIKGKALPVGTIRVYHGQKFVKHADGWVALTGQKQGKLVDWKSGGKIHAKHDDAVHGKFHEDHSHRVKNMGDKKVLEPHEGHDKPQTITPEKKEASNLHKKNTEKLTKLVSQESKKQSTSQQFDKNETYSSDQVADYIAGVTADGGGLSWLRDSHKEGLDSFGKEWVMREVPIDKLSHKDIHTSGDDHDREKVEKYQKLYEKTKDGPPLVVKPNGSVQDGVHRATAAKRAGLKTIKALVLKGSEFDTESPQKEQKGKIQKELEAKHEEVDKKVKEVKKPIKSEQQGSDWKKVLSEKPYGAVVESETGKQYTVINAQLKDWKTGEKTYTVKDSTGQQYFLGNDKDYKIIKPGKTLEEHKEENSKKDIKENKEERRKRIRTLAEKETSALLELQEVNPELADALRYYTREGYTTMKRLQRGEIKPDTSLRERAYQALKNLDKHWEDLPVHDGPIVRGLEISYHDLEKLKDSFKEGKTYEIDSYSSFSKGGEPREDFRGNVSLIVQNSKSGRTVGAFSQYPDEEEVLVPKGTKYKITKVVEGDPMEVHMEEAMQKSNKDKSDHNDWFNSLFDEPVFAKKKNKKKDEVKKSYIELAVSLIKSTYTDTEYQSLSQSQKNNLHIEALNIVKGKKLPIGTIRTYGNYKYIKHADGWVGLTGPKAGKLVDFKNGGKIHAKHSSKHKEFAEAVHGSKSPGTKEVGDKGPTTSTTSKPSSSLTKMSKPTFDEKTHARKRFKNIISGKNSNDWGHHVSLRTKKMTDIGKLNAWYDVVKDWGGFKDELKEIQDKMASMGYQPSRNVPPPSSLQSLPDKKLEIMGYDTSKKLKSAPLPSEEAISGAQETIDYIRQQAITSEWSDLFSTKAKSIKTAVEAHAWYQALKHDKKIESVKDEALKEAKEKLAQFGYEPNDSFEYAPKSSSKKLDIAPDPGSDVMSSVRMRLDHVKSKPTNQWQDLISDKIKEITSGATAHAWYHALKNDSKAHWFKDSAIPEVVAKLASLGYKPNDNVDGLSGESQKKEPKNEFVTGEAAKNDLLQNGHVGAKVVTESGKPYTISKYVKHPSFGPSMMTVEGTFIHPEYKYKITKFGEKGDLEAMPKEVTEKDEKEHLSGSKLKERLTKMASSGGFQELSSLNRPLYEALKFWTGGGYSAVRSYQVGTHTSSKDKAEHAVKYLEKHWDDLPDYDKSIRRGLNISDFVVQSAFKEGNIFETEAFTSFGKGDSSFSGNVQMIVSKNKSGKLLNRMSMHPHENEVLVPKGTKYKITKVEKSNINNRYTIHLEEID